jgi:hypothetical protein
MAPDEELELKRELETYYRQLPRLLQGHEGQFVLIHGDTVDSFWPTEDAGYEAGCDRFGVDPFLVKQVLRDEPIFFSSVDILP